jgi:hypothetical protein
MIDSDAAELKSAAGKEMTSCVDEMNVAGIALACTTTLEVGRKFVP